MKPILRVLIIEDSEDDALLVMWNIRKGPYEIQSERVDNEAALLHAIDQKTWDIILCDYALPGFSGFEALTIVKQKQLDIPFIFVSGTMGEDIAVEAMHMGAHDYVMKGNLTRLLPAIERELKEATVRREKKAAEEEIVKAKNDWERTFDAVPDLIILLDNNFRILRANKAMADKLKLNPGQCIGQTCYGLVHGTEQPHDLCPHVKLLKDGQEHSSEIFEQLLGGDYLITTSPLFDDAGNIEGSVHVARDITERKKAELELKENEERFRSIFTNNLSVMMLVDPSDGTIVDVNQSAVHFYGWPREELLRKKISDIYAADSEELQSLFKSALNSPQIHFEFKHNLADGSVRDVEIFSSKIEIRGKEFLQSIVHDVTDRKKAEQELEHERYLMKTLMDNFPDAIYFKDKESRFTRVSRNLISRHHFPGIENILGMTDTDLFSGQHARQALEDEKKIMETGQPIINYEEEETFADGTRSWVLTTKLPLYDSKGDISGTFGISRDITERKHIEEDLRLSEERFKHVALITGEWIWEIDRDGLFTYASPIVEEVLGYKPEEIVGKKHFYDLYLPEEKEKFKNEILELIKKKKPIKNHIKANVHKSGSVVYIETNGVPILDKNNVLTGYRGADADKTKLIQSVHELEASERRFRSYFELPIIGIAITNPAKQWIDANDSLCQMFGYSREELTKLRWTDMTHPDDLQQNLDYFNLAMEGKLDQYQMEKRFIGKDGRIVFVDLAVGVVRKADGSLDYLISTFNDISERKKAEEELRISEDKFRVLIENQGEGVTLVNENEVFTFANPAAEQIFGVGQGKLVNRNLSEFVSPEQYAEIRAESGKRSRLEKSNYEIEITTPNGEKKDILVTATPQTDKHGDYIGTFGVFRDITYRKKVENEIKLSLSLLQATLDSTTDGIVVIDVQGKITGYNKQFQQMWNIPDDHIQTSHASLLLPLVIDKVTNSELFLEKARNLHAHQSKKSFDILTLNDGRIFEHYSIPQMLDNRIIGRVWSFRDITDRTRAEDERKLSEQKYRELADFLPSGIFESNAEGIITYANRVGLDWIGYSEEELFNKVHIKDLIADEDREKALNRFVLVMKNNEIFSGEYTAIRKNGSIFPALITSKSMVKNGETTGLRGVITDLTQFKQAEEALKSSEEKYKRILETSVEGVLSTDISGKIMFVNDAFSRMLGYGSDELVGIQIDTLILPEEIERHNAESQSRKNGIKAQYIRRFVRKNGTRVWTLVSATPVYDEKGNFAGSFAMLSDITSQKEAELELRMHREHLEELVKERTDALLRSEENLKKAIHEAESANRAKSEFLANISHEIRTPMNAILGYSEILHRLVSDPVQKDYLNSIQLSGKTLLDLINNVLDLSKIEVGKLQVQLEPVNLPAIILEIASIFKLIVKSKGLNLYTQIEENFPTQVLLDELKIRQILINLINNAIKFTDSGSIRISAGTRRTKNGKVSLELAVQDTGKGISAEQHQFVFEPFAQTASVDKKKQSGTGLGLTISKQLAELLHGTILLESEEGKGSTFIVLFNDVEVVEDGRAMRNETVNPDIVLFKPASVMVTDDDLDNRKVMAGYLKAFPFKLSEARNGVEMLKLLPSIKPDLILLDLTMPEMDGFEAIKIIREDKDMKHITVIAVTASAFKEDENKILQAGFDDYLRKPVSLSVLVNSMCKFLPHELLITSEDTGEPEWFAGISYKITVEIVSDLEKQLMPEWKSLGTIKPQKTMIGFAEKIIKTGKKYDCMPVVRYGEALLSAVKSFNVDKQKTLIAEIPEFINQLKHHMKE